MSLYDLEIADWQKLLIEQPSYRPAQIWRAIHERALRPEQLTSLPKALRANLAQTPDLGPALRLIRLSSDEQNMTQKALFELSDGRVIETVLMHYRDRSTVCISSQAGCAMGCAFCATGQLGYFRHLSVGEIVEQVIWAISKTRAVRGEKRLSNIVFMGMGEPLANTDNVFKSLKRINSDIGIGSRHITVSTVGIIPGIERFTALDSQFNLAVSLHAANNHKRTSLIPINSRYPIEALMDALARYVESSRRRISFEWAMIEDINDTAEDARELIALCVPLEAHVNLIPLNPTPGWPTRGSSMKVVRDFADMLDDAGIAVSVRDNRGTNIAAACGQLAGSVGTGIDTKGLEPDNSGRISAGTSLD